MLGQGGRAVIADVADGDAELLGGANVDVVGARCGNGDEPQPRRLCERLPGHVRRIEEHDLERCDALRDLGRRRGIMEPQIRQRFEQAPRVEVRVGNGIVIEECRLHGA